MKLLLILALIGLAVSSVCPKFECELIDPAGKQEDNRVCGQKVVRDGHASYIFDDNCEIGYHCSGEDIFVAGTSLPEYIFCKETPSDDNTRLPGDMCHFDSQCMGTTECGLDFECVAKKPNLGDQCFDHEDCSAGQYCYQNDCTAVKELDETCNPSIGDQQCGFGAGCFNDPDGPTTCIPYLSLPAGKKMAYNSDVRFCYQHYYL